MRRSARSPPKILKRLGKVAADGAGRATAGLVQAHILRTILIAVAASLLLLIGAFGAGYWFHGSQQLVAGVSAGKPATQVHCSATSRQPTPMRGISIAPNP